MDIGSFVLDAEGVRWAVDLGAEGYHGIESRGMNLWDRSQDSDRWRIFRQSNFGHNTLVINAAQQLVDGSARVIHFSSDLRFPFSIVDMSSLYLGQAESVWRGVALPNGRVVLIQDELTGLSTGSRVRWGMITPARAHLSGPRAQLNMAGRSLQLSIEEPQGARWLVVNTEEPQNEWDSPNPGTRMLAFEAIAPDSGELTLRVVAAPGSVEEDGWSFKRLQEWASGVRRQD
jgi:hypothetical protein